MIKHLSIFFLCLVLQFPVNGQETSNLTIRVVDHETGIAVNQAKVIVTTKNNSGIKHSYSDLNGIVPEFQITNGLQYEVTVQGDSIYLTKSRSILVTEQRTEIFRLFRAPEKNSFAFTGKVKDSISGENLDKVRVELKIGKYTNFTKTDSYGNYIFYLQEEEIEPGVNWTLEFLRKNYKIQKKEILQKIKVYNYEVNTYLEIEKIIADVALFPVLDTTDINLVLNEGNFEYMASLGLIRVIFLKTISDTTEIILTIQRDCFHTLELRKPLKYFVQNQKTTLYWEKIDTDLDGLPDCVDQCPFDDFETKTGCPSKIRRLIPGLYSKGLEGEGNVNKTKTLVTLDFISLGLIVGGGSTFILSNEWLSDASTQEARNRNLLGKKIGYGALVAGGGVLLSAYLTDALRKNDPHQFTNIQYFISPSVNQLSIGLSKKF